MPKEVFLTLVDHITSMVSSINQMEIRSILSGLQEQRVSRFSVISIIGIERNLDVRKMSSVVTPLPLKQTLMVLQELNITPSIKLILRDQMEIEWIEIQLGVNIRFRIREQIYMTAFNGIQLKSMSGNIKDPFHNQHRVIEFMSLM